jgi:CheY-like chemotaxis protein/glycine cleavage system H lipoate-binding protein
MTAQRDILVIEDEPMVTRAVELVCEDDGLSVTAVESATGALQHLEEHQFRLILCDIMMQELDGFGFLQELDRRGIQTPVIMMTGYSTVENAVRSLAGGAVDYIPKPFTADELLTVVHRSLRSSALLAEAESAKPDGRWTGELGFVPCPDNYLSLGYVSWVLMEDEGTARIGVSDLFLKAAEGLREIELVEAGEDVAQGIPCAVITAPNGAQHGMMCPMSGKVLEVNEEIRAQPELVEKDPYFKGWLYRILPSDPGSDLQWLSL